MSEGPRFQSNNSPALILAFDYGTRRIGVAAGDTLTRTARGLLTVDNAESNRWAAISRLIADYAPAQLVVGLPFNMDGTETTLTPVVRAFAQSLAGRFRLPVSLVDERQSSREAEKQLRDARASGFKRRRVTHADVDMTAAKVLLERWLSSERTTLIPNSSQVQRGKDGTLRHLITLEGLSRQEIIALLDLAQFYVRPSGDLPARDQSLAGHTVANLFFEPSTRTRVSFELAARRLGAEVVNLDMHSSSRVKGETVLDTIYTLQAMHADILVMRDAEPGLPANVAMHVAPHVSILNAGEAHLSHPTQGLLDALTIRQRKGSFENLCVLLVGDLAHSRVARSAFHVLTALGAGELRIAGPGHFMPSGPEFAGAQRFTNLDQALNGVDVIMALRIQKERMALAQIPDDNTYCREFGLTPERVRLAKPDAIVMHPAPMNRGVEITSEVADGPQSVIQLQVTNGVAVRMAVLATIVRNAQARRHW